MAVIVGGAAVATGKVAAVGGGLVAGGVVGTAVKAGLAAKILAGLGTAAAVTGVGLAVLATGGAAEEMKCDGDDSCENNQDFFLAGLSSELDFSI